MSRRDDAERLGFTHIHCRIHNWSGYVEDYQCPHCEARREDHRYFDTPPQEAEDEEEE